MCFLLLERKCCYYWKCRRFGLNRGEWNTIITCCFILLFSRSSFLIHVSRMVYCNWIIKTMNTWVALTIHYSLPQCQTTFTFTFTGCLPCLGGRSSCGGRRHEGRPRAVCESEGWGTVIRGYCSMLRESDSPRHWSIGNWELLCCRAHRDQTTIDFVVVLNWSNIRETHAFLANLMHISRDSGPCSLLKFHSILIVIPINTYRNPNRYLP